MTNLVTFPGLGLSFEVNRVAFTIGGMNIYWYGVLIATGIVLAILFAFRHCAEFGIDGDAMTDVIVVGVVMAIISVPLNYFLTYPAYVVIYGMPLDTIIGMYQAILPSAGSLLECLVIFNMPWTLAKGLLDAVLCMLIYKPLSPILHGRR